MESKLSSYELARLANIRKNREFMASIGLGEAKASAKACKPEVNRKQAVKVKPQRSRKTKGSEPSRRSARKRGAPARYTGENIDFLVSNAAVGHCGRDPKTDPAGLLGATFKRKYVGYGTQLWDVTVTKFLGDGEEKDPADAKYEVTADEDGHVSTMRARAIEKCNPVRKRAELPQRKKRRKGRGSRGRQPPPLTDAQRETLESSGAWLDELETFLLRTPHGRLGKVCSDDNARSVMNQVRKLVSGAGIDYHHWPEGVAFRGGHPVTLADDFVAMYANALEFEDEHGRDLGNGWLLRHPIVKLQCFQIFKIACAEGENAARN